MKKMVVWMILVSVLISFPGTAFAASGTTTTAITELQREYEEMLETYLANGWVLVSEIEAEELLRRATITETFSDNVRRNGILLGRAYIDVHYYVPGMVYDGWSNVRVIKDSDPNILECTLLDYDVVYSEVTNQLAVLMQIYGRHAAGAEGAFFERDVYVLS